METIRYQESDFQYPKGKLKESQIENIETWIKRGIWPDDEFLNCPHKRSVFNIEKDE